MTESAQVARIIRNELKARFPGVKFSVKSSIFSGGDSVDISYVMENRFYPTEKTIYSIVNKYQAGTFNGSEDVYEYTNKTEGVTVKYVMVQADTRKLMDEYQEEFLKHFGLAAYDDQEVMKKLGCWKQQALYRYVYQNVLTNN